jgi:serine/threonine protein kinase
MDELRTALPPEIDSRYELLRVLGAGAVGTVYLVRDTRQNNRLCALKLLYPHLCAEERTLRRFKREVLLSRHLPHPAIAQVYEFHQRNLETAYFVMEYIEGRTLAECIAEDSPLNLRRVYFLSWQIASALMTAHQKGIVHRDIKPQNIIVTADDLVKVTDFGLACLVEDDAGLTKTGASLGTPQYMSPEQFRGEKVGTQSDMYSFGVLLFELLTGQRPFSATVFYELALQHLTLEFPDVRTLRPDTPDWLAECVIDSTRKESSQRRLTAKDFVERFAEVLDDRYLQQQETIRRRRRSQQIHRVLRKTPWIAGVGLALSAVLVFLTAIMARFDSESYREVGTAVITIERRLAVALPLTRKIFGLRVGWSDRDRVSSFVLSSGGDKANLSDASILLRVGAFEELDPGARRELVQKFCRGGDSSLTEMIFADRAMLDDFDSSGNPCVHQAVIRVESGMFDRLQRLGADPHQPNAYGETVYHHHAKMGSTHWLQTTAHSTFVQITPEVMNMRDTYGLTPLHVALRRKAEPSFVRLLIRLGADIAEPFPDGTPVLEYVKMAYPAEKQVQIKRALLPIANQGITVPYDPSWLSR